MTARFDGLVAAVTGAGSGIGRATVDLLLPDGARVARQPIGRLGRADEVAEAIAYVASPEAGYVTGTSLAIDGGIAGFRIATD